ncbi:acid protease [Mycena vitilis]|nr:acid protease [Mycena vitilis]
MGIASVLALLSLLTGSCTGRAENNAVVASSFAVSTKALVVPLTARIPRRKSKKDAFVSLDTPQDEKNGNLVRLNGAAFDHEYVVNASVGGKYFNLILDTGSSDLWVVQDGFSCLDLNGTAVPASMCDFGPSHYNPADSPTFQPFPNVTFFVQYGSGEHLKGPAGFDDVKIGGLSVTQQIFGLPNDNAFLGDGVSEGVLGLAFPRLTSVYNSTGQMQYTPFFLSAVEQKKVENPVFSISLDRPTFDQSKNDPFDPKLGLLAFGGIVPVPVLNISATVPVQRFSGNIPSNSDNATSLWYTVDVDSYTFPNSSALTTASNNTILDSGATFNYLPTPIAAAFIALFSPPATLNSTSGLYVIDCNATAPAFAATIGGALFTVDGRDQIVPQGNDADACWSGTQDGGPDVAGNVFTLGDVFLHNVVTTFNPVAGEFTLTQRAPY